MAKVSAPSWDETEEIPSWDDTEELPAGTATPPGRGMGDVRMAESPEGPPEQPSTMSAFAGPVAQAGVKAGAAGLRFLGDVGTALTTGPVNAVAQGIQDDAGVLGTLRNVARAAFDPVIPGRSPIQSTETSLERAGMPNVGKDMSGDVPGFHIKMNPEAYGYSPAQAMGIDPRAMVRVNHRQPGRAQQAGMVLDIVTPAPAAVAAKAVGGMAKVAAQSKLAKTSPAFREMAERVQNTVIRPRQGDWNSGYDIKAVEKYGVQGNVDEVIAKSDDAIKQASDKLKAVLDEGNGGPGVDIKSAIESARKQAYKDVPAQDLKRLNQYFDEIQGWADDAIKRAGGDAGRVNLLDAHRFKQDVGAAGAWQYAANRGQRTLTKPEADLSGHAERVYHILKKEIEGAAPEGVKELNKTISDLIPIRSAAQYRKIVQDRNNPIDLKSFMGLLGAASGSPGTMAVAAANKFTTTGYGAKKLYEMARKLEGAKDPAEALFYKQAIKREFGLDPEDLKALKTRNDAIPGGRRPLELAPGETPSLIAPGKRRSLEPTRAPAPAAREPDLSGNIPDLAFSSRVPEAPKMGSYYEGPTPNPDFVRRPPSMAIPDEYFPPTPMKEPLGLPPRRPKIETNGQSKAMPNKEPESFRSILNNLGRRPLVSKDEKVAELKKQLAGAKGKEKSQLLRELARINWKNPNRE